MEEGGQDRHPVIKGTDDLIRQLGHPGRFQVLVFVLLALNYFPVVFHHVCMAFYGYTPPLECHPQQQTAAPGSHGGKGVNRMGGDDVVFGSCDVVVTSEKGVNRSQRCEAGQVRYLVPPREKTVVMEWDLVCDRAYMAHLSTTVYYCGVMLGGFACGYLSDRFGRRPVLLGTLAAGTLLGTALGFVRHFPVFVAMRFLLGLLMQGLHSASYIMAVELFPVEERTLAGCVIQLFWGGAVLALGGVAWALRHWRHVQLAISLPSLLAVTYFWLVPESLRWLLAKQRRAQAEQLIRRIASFNKLDSHLTKHPELATCALLQPLAPLPERTAGGLDVSGKENGEEEKERMKTKEKEEKEEEEKMAQGSVKDLFSTNVMLKRSLVLFYIWFAGNVSYFGLTFMSTSLAGDRYLNYSLSALVEFFAYVITIFVIRRFGRRNPLALYFTVAAISCLGVGLVPSFRGSGTDLRAMIIGFSVVGKFAAGGSFTFLDLLTVEMYPTVLRNVGAGMCAFWGRLGAVLAPQCLSLGLYTFSQLPAILIGVLTLVGALVTLLLPDTSHIRLPDTVYDITVKDLDEEGGSGRGVRITCDQGSDGGGDTAGSESLLDDAETVSTV